MRPIRRLLVATDFSERSALAEMRAALLCETLNCRALEILTVIDIGPREQEPQVPSCVHAASVESRVGQAWKELDRISKRIYNKYRIPCRLAVKVGRPTSEIIARADEISADLVVVGAHGAHYSGDLYLGSTADKLARMTTRPLLIVGIEPEGPYQEAFVPVDFSLDSVRAAEMALQVAPKAHVTFLYSFDMRFEEHMLEAGVSTEGILKCRSDAYGYAQRELDRFIADLGPTSQPILRGVRSGASAKMIGRYAELIKPGLVAIGKYGGSRLVELILGSSMRRAANKEICDVLIASAFGIAKEERERVAA